MDLEQCVDYVMSLGADGVELLPDQMLHGTPNPSEETLAYWDRIVDWILEPCLEEAEKHDVALCIEIHGGLGFGVPKTEEFLEEMMRLDSPYVGIVPDSSCFCRRPPRVVDEYCMEVMGTNPDLIKYVRDVFESGRDIFNIELHNGGRDPEMEKYIKDPVKDTFYTENAIGYEMQTHITYYRGIPLSMVNYIRVETDGVEVPQEDIRFTSDKIDWFTLDEMTTVSTIKWEYDQAATVFVQKDGGLSKGSHDVKLTVCTRTAYIPFPIEGIMTRTVTI